MSDLPGMEFSADLPDGSKIRLRGHITESQPDKIREQLRCFNYLIFQSLMVGDIAKGLGVPPLTKPFESPDMKSFFRRRPYTKKKKEAANA